MSEKRKPVICPWCRSEMRLWEDGAMAWFECMDCGAQTPTVDSEADDTPTETLRKMAYSAATQRPPNRPLLLPELFDLEDDDAAWVVAENGKIYAMGAECAQELASEEHCLFFARKPTPEDIEAARVDGVANP